MEMPMEIACKGIERTERLQQTIDKNAARLDKVCDHIISCRLAIEQPHAHPGKGSDCTFTLLVRLPPNQEIVVKRTSGEGGMHDALAKEIKEVFQTAARQCREVARQQRDEVKRHPEQESNAIVSQLSPDRDFGFLRTLDGREIYFHHNSVIHDDIDRIAVGTGVHFTEELGAKGPQASTVAIVDKPASPSE